MIFHIFADETPPWYLGLYEAESEESAVSKATLKHPERANLRAKPIDVFFVTAAIKYCSVNV